MCLYYVSIIVMCRWKLPYVVFLPSVKRWKTVDIINLCNGCLLQTLNDSYDKGSSILMCFYLSILKQTAVFLQALRAMTGNTKHKDCCFCLWPAPFSSRLCMQSRLQRPVQLRWQLRPARIQEYHLPASHRHPGCVERPQAHLQK